MFEEVKSVLVMGSDFTELYFAVVMMQKYKSQSVDMCWNGFALNIIHIHYMHVQNSKYRKNIIQKRTNHRFTNVFCETSIGETYQPVRRKTLIKKCEAVAPNCRQTCNITCTKSKKLNLSHLVLQLVLPNPLKPGVKSKMKMLLERRR